MEVIVKNVNGVNIEKKCSKTTLQIGEVGHCIYKFWKHWSEMIFQYTYKTADTIIEQNFSIPGMQNIIF